MVKKGTRHPPIRTEIQRLLCKKSALIYAYKRAYSKAFPAVFRIKSEMEIKKVKIEMRPRDKVEAMAANEQQKVAFVLARAGITFTI